MKKIMVLLCMLAMAQPVLAVEFEDGGVCDITVTSIHKFPACFIQQFLEKAATILAIPTTILGEILFRLITFEPPIKPFHALWMKFNYIVSGFYLLILLWSGVNLMVSSLDMRKRQEAKTQIRNVFVMILMVNLSFFFFGVLLDFATALARWEWTLIDPAFFGGDNVFHEATSMLVMLGMYPYYLPGIIDAVRVIIIEKIAVVLGAILLPVTIMFYFTNPLREYGSVLLNLTLLAVFLPCINVLILIIAGEFASNPILGFNQWFWIDAALKLMVYTVKILVVLIILKAAIRIIWMRKDAERVVHGDRVIVSNPRRGGVFAQSVPIHGNQPWRRRSRYQGGLR